MSTGVRLARHFLTWLPVSLCAFSRLFRLARLAFFVRVLVLGAVGLGGQAAWGAGLEELEVISDPGTDGWYAKGDDIRVRATFDERVGVRHTPDLKLRIDVGGTQRLAALVNAGPARQYTFTYRVQDGDWDDDGIDIDHNPFRYGVFFDLGDETTVNVATATLPVLPGHKVDGVAPRVTGAPAVRSDPNTDDTYVAGETIEFDISFDENIRVTGNPELVLSFGRNGAMAAGTLSRRASMVRARATRLTFQYVVQAGDHDTDGITIRADALQGGTILDERGNPARRQLVETSYAGHLVDGVAPAVEGIEITSEPAEGDAYGRGEVIEVEVTFDDVVYVEAAPNLYLDIGGAPQRAAAYVNGSGTRRLTFRYTVQNGDVDDDGISIGPRALIGPNPPNGLLVDGVGNAVIRPVILVPGQPNHKVDGQETNPAATVARVTSPRPSSGSYRVGDVIEAEVDFNVPVWVTEPREPDEDLELRLILSIGEHSRYAVFSDGSGTQTLTFRYTVQAGDYDEDGIAINPNALVGATVADVAGIVANRRFAPLRADSRYGVDARRPASLMAPSVIRGGPYGLGEPITIEVRLNEPVHVIQTDDNMLTLVLAIGERTRRARFIGGSGTDTLTFRYTVRADDYADDGFSIGADALVGATIEDNAGNDWPEADRRLVPLPPRRSNRVNGGLPDDGEPVVMGVEITPNVREDTTYELNENIDIQVSFNEAVYVQGTPLPTLAIAIGGNLRNATLFGGSGTDKLMFRYTVQAADGDSCVTGRSPSAGGSISIGPDALSGGAIVDAAGNPAIRRFIPEEDEYQGYCVDGEAPQVEDLMPDKPQGSFYVLGEAIQVSIEYTEVVYVTGSLQLVISIGENSRHATFVDGSGSDTLLFRYVVQAGDYDDDGIAIGPDALVGGTIEDRAGNDVLERRLLPWEANRDYRVDAAVGTVRITSVVIRPRPPEETARPRPYRAGENIYVEIKFNEGVDVHVTGSPTLELLVGSTPRQAALIEGSGTNTLTFRYVVQSGDYDDDGISISTGVSSLKGGTLQDSAGNDIARAFPAEPADPAHRVDAVQPQVQRVTITSSPAAAATYRAGERIEAAVDYSDDVSIVASNTNLALVLTIGEHQREAAVMQAAGTTTRRLTFRYTVQGGDFDADGISIGSDALKGGRILDRVEKTVEREIDPLPNQSGHLVGAEQSLAFSLDLTVGGPPGVFDLYEDILTAQGLRHYAGLYQAPASDRPDVATARVSGHRLVITPQAEGSANVLVVAQDAAINLLFTVTVAASNAEVAVLQHALAAMGRGILASAAHTVGTRLETTRRHSRSGFGGQRIRMLPNPATGIGDRAERTAPALSCAAGGAWCSADRTAGRQHWPDDRAHAALDTFGDPLDNARWRNAGVSMGRDTAFEMPLIGGVGPGTSWGLWGAGDFQTFEGEPESSAYDGNVSAAYVGVDAKGENWLAGVAAGRVNADADYQFTVDGVTSKGTLETTLTTLSPYMQWSLGERAEMWAMAGVGRGEASIERESRPSPAKPIDLTMRMGMAGLRTEIAKAGNYRFALRGEIGSVQLETDSGETAIHGLAVNSQRARLGVEASFPLVTKTGGEFAPFVDIGGRYDGGDGQTGAGVEVAAGVRASSSTVRFEAKGRTLVMAGDDGYTETGASASVVIEPGTEKTGLRVSLAPRWGGDADAMDVFWRKETNSGLKAFKREMERGWGVAGRVDYGIAVTGRRGGEASVRPFGEVDVAADDNRRMRIGMAYELDSPVDKPLRFELSSERVERAAGTEHRLLLSAEGRF